MTPPKKIYLDRSILEDDIYEIQQDGDIEYIRADTIPAIVKTALEMAIANVGSLRIHGIGTRKQFYNRAVNKAQDVIKRLIHKDYNYTFANKTTDPEIVKQLVEALEFAAKGFYRDEIVRKAKEAIAQYHKE